MVSEEKHLHYLSARLMERMDVTADLMILRLEPEKTLAFQPGQFCTLALEGVARPYSMVSSPEDPRLELFIERVPVGEFTERLWRLQTGDGIKINPRIKGRFLFEAAMKNHLMVSTVTGIAPFLSMIRHLAAQGTLAAYQITVFQGVSYADEFGYDKELLNLNQRGLLTYIPTVSRPLEPRNLNWSGETGKVNEVFANFLNGADLSPQDTIIYACGHPGMTGNVRQIARAAEFPFKEEKYFVSK